MKQGWIHRVISFLILLTLLGQPLMYVDARETANKQEMIGSYIGWVDGDDAYMQMRLAKAYDEIEVSLAAADTTDSLTIRKSDRVSVSWQHTPHVLLQIRAYDSGRLAYTALYKVMAMEEKQEDADHQTTFKLEKQSWESNPEGEPLALQQIVGEESARDSVISKQTATYYQLVYGTKTPDGTEEKSKPSEKKLLKIQSTAELEPNDTLDKADLTFLGKDAFGTIQKKGDVDYWKLVPTKSGKLKIWLGTIPKGQNYDLYFYNSKGTELAHSELDGSMDELIEGSAAQVEKGSLYYIKVKGHGDDAHKTGRYKLRADFQQPTSAVNPDTYEPNDLLGTATPAQNDVTYRATIHTLADVDYYKYEVPLASTLTFTISDLPKGMDLDLFLEDSNLKVLAKSDKPQNANEEIVFNAEPGFYYLKVTASSRSAISEHEYKLLGKIRTIPIILIPGISGSRLLSEENGEVKEAWLDAGGMILDNFKDVHRRVLPLTPKRAGSTEVVQKAKGVKISPEQDDHGLHAVEYLSYAMLVKSSAEQYYSMSQHLDIIQATFFHLCS